MTEAHLTNDELRLLEERLPWYVNASLGRVEADWIDQLVARSAEARHLLECERALRAATPRMLASAPPDIGLDRLMARVAAARPPVEQAPHPRGIWNALRDWLTQPGVATAMALAVLVQAGALAWLAVPHGPEDTAGMRSTPVTEVRTLRVTFAPTASASAA